MFKMFSWFSLNFR